MLVGIVFAVGACGSCVPVTEHYYAPSGEDADVISTTCAGGPPFAARLNGDRSSVLVFLDSPTLSIQIRANGLDSAIELDPTLIRATVDGESQKMNPIHYTAGKSAGATALVADSTIKVTTDLLTIHLPLKLQSSQDIVIHLPPISVDGKMTIFPEIPFKWQTKRHFAAVIVNC